MQLQLSFEYNALQRFWRFERHNEPLDFQRQKKSKLPFKLMTQFQEFND